MTIRYLFLGFFYFTFLFSFVSHLEMHIWHGYSKRQKGPHSRTQDHYQEYHIRFMDCLRIKKITTTTNVTNINYVLDLGSTYHFQLPFFIQTLVYSIRILFLDTKIHCPFPSTHRVFFDTHTHALENSDSSLGLVNVIQLKIVFPFNDPIPESSNLKL